MWRSRSRRQSEDEKSAEGSARESHDTPLSPERRHAASEGSSRRLAFFMIPPPPADRPRASDSGERIAEFEGRSPSNKTRTPRLLAARHLYGRVLDRRRSRRDHWRLDRRPRVASS